VKAYLDAGGLVTALVQVHGEQLPLLHSMAVTNAHPHRELAESMRLLIAAGADIEASYTDLTGVNVTPLMCAAGRQFCTAVCCTAVQAACLKAGADPCAQPQPHCLTALHKAAKQGLSESYKLLVARADTLLESRDHLGRTALRYASVNGYVHTVQVLLQCGADINAVDSLGRTALFSASSSGQIDVVVCLLKAGADVNVVDSAGDSALVAAVHSGGVVLTRLLLALGADFSAANTASHRALSIAADQGNVPMMELLVQRGVSVTGVDAAGTTLLMQAASRGHKAAAEWLLQRGVAVAAENNIGSAALHVASGSSGPDDDAAAAVIELLLANGADVHKCNHKGEAALDIAAAHGNVQCAKALIAEGADVNHAIPGSTNTLHTAIIGNSAAVVQLLLEHGATATMNSVVPLRRRDNARGYVQATALMLCAEPAVVKVLLAAGADVHVRTDAGDTCLHVAAGYKTSAAVLCLLAKAGADLHAVNNEGKTAAQIAHDVGNTLIEQLLNRAAHQRH
jgi:ankyrin repeat protein